MPEDPSSEGRASDPDSRPPARDSRPPARDNRAPRRDNSGDRSSFRSSGSRGGERSGSQDDRRHSGDRRHGADRGQSPDRGRGQGGQGAQGGPRRRGGEGSFGPRAGGGRGPDARAPRPVEPDLPDDIDAKDLEPGVRRDLLSLDKSNAEAVARHMVMVSRLIGDDPAAALLHARAARQRAGRIAVVRETAGIAAYHAGEWAEALSELRAARRMAGGPGLLSVMADCERGLGRPERAIELGRSDEARMLTGDDASELRIVVAGARMDMGQYDQAVVTLQTPDLEGDRTGSAAARLYYAYADALVAAGRADDGVQWFLRAAGADVEGETDAEDRVDELTGQ
ncbi:MULTISPECIES: hypothetical protein [unclassified Rhodococcus (in: high G+C Gram-positive bacteria)]|uniref:hypothetical protein n=1 Tax=unclassified Rhodococcus (in: high G+C Gram-positive bacteria) TaxID=192944 RepID=UPI003FA6DD04